MAVWGGRGAGGRASRSVRVLVAVVMSTVQTAVDASCIEYEPVVNGSGHRLRTCPLNHPPSYVYCCVDTCCEEPHMAILMTSVVGGVVIGVIGVGLVVLCAVDMHRVTCQARHDLESPLLSNEEDAPDESKLPPGGKWCIKHKVMGAPPLERTPNRSCDASPQNHAASAATCTATYYTVTSHTQNANKTDVEDELEV